MRKKIVLKSMLSAAMAMSMLFSAVGTNTAFAAGSEKVSFDISKDKISDKTSKDKNFLGNLLKKDLSKKIVLISTSDIHGALLEFTYVSQLRNLLEEKGAEVLIVDSGDFSTDKDVDNYVKKTNMLDNPSLKTRGIAPVKIMNAVGYDIICLGNHEFEKKKTDLDDIISEANFKIVDANISKDKYAERIQPNLVLGKRAKIGFFGLDSLENNGWYRDYNFECSDEATYLHECAQNQVKELQDKNADVIIGLTHLGVDDDPGKRAAKNLEKVKDDEALWPQKTEKQKKEDPTGKYDLLYKKGIRSVDLFADVKGIDLLLDGHSHTTMTGCKYFEDFNIQSCGIQFQNIGVVVIGNDNEDKKYEIENRFLIPEQDYDQIGEDEKISGYIGYVLSTIDEIGEMSADKARSDIKDFDPNEDYSEYYFKIDSGAYERINKTGISSDSSAADDSSSIEASLPENELEATEAASSASIENEDAANSASSEDEANIEESTEETSSDDSSNDNSNDKSGKTGDHHRERHHHRNYKHGFGG